MKKKFSAGLIAMAALLCLSLPGSAWAKTTMTYPQWYYDNFGTWPEGTSSDWKYDSLYYQYEEEMLYGEEYVDDEDPSTYGYMDEAYWKERTAKWTIEGKASRYEVYLYRDETLITSKKTTGKSLNMAGYMSRKGYYWFQVRCYNQYTGWSDWVESDNQYFTAYSGATGDSGSSSGSSGTASIGNEYGPSGTVPTYYDKNADAYSSNQTGTAVTDYSPVYSSPASMMGGKVGWNKASDGRWWYAYENGAYPIGTWQAIDGKWYYFDQEGWMATGWVEWNGGLYHCWPDGSMTTGTALIDGVWHTFDGSGKLVY